MDILRPRGTYQRINSRDSTIPWDSGSDMELSSPLDHKINNNNDNSRTPRFRSGFSATIKDQAPLLDPSTDPVRHFKPAYFHRPNFLGGHSRLYGWRTGALFAASFAGISFLINLVVLVWLSTHRSSSGLVELFNGSCSKVENMDLWVHLAINALSTLLLGGSNYCMQCLCAPTRKDVDAAHAQGKWLDIGVPSIRNLRRVPVYKSVMWLMLGLSSVPLHLMYNSAFYKSLSTNDYAFYFATQDFVDGSSFTIPERTIDPYYLIIGSVEPAKVQSDLQTPGLYERLEMVDCIHAYATDFLTNRRNLVMVSKNDTANSSLLDMGFYAFSTINPFVWICVSDPNLDLYGDNGNWEPCEKLVSKVEAAADADQWRPYGYDVQYCLSELVPERCSYNGNIPIVAVVLVANLIKVVSMLWLAFRVQDAPLITVGDAVESFLNESDRTTQGVCLLTKEEVVKLARRKTHWQEQGDDKDKDENKSSTKEAKVAQLQRLRWSKAASRTRWSVTIGFIVIALIVVGVLLSRAVSTVNSAGFTIQDVGFGKVTPWAIVTGWNVGEQGSATNRIMSSILVANLPQTIFSFLYLNLNGLLTSMWLASEWSDFATQRKTLRVSKPKGAQRSTHFLQLPYKVAMPLMVLSGLLHWMISQAIFLVVLAEYNSDGTLASPVAVASCGFSPLAMILALAAGGVIIITTLVLGFARHYDPAIPLAGSCSVAISAACHQPDWDHDAAMKPVKWGVIPDGLVAHDRVDQDMVGHCSFTSGDAGPLQHGNKYA
ncbi:hypothetical protein A1O3_05831 [Capronia epimyces CBS 606.96]|uniref:DUF6536 domain-containing protein n=1 Tax=Capronia epimyces CBS 606.96 TaxID=1182542 RepID=W9Y7D0_9EURO|nr:uncharacterized protein A1O3_05831 [Capronia epimyces CBS 606.96]EXJ85156.1 hypothetical protein A1O3_05831 [Capronia epimyces CBS 606.96]